MCVCVAGRRARWLMPPLTWTTWKPSANSTTTTDKAARDSGRRSAPAQSCSSAPASEPWQVRGHAHPYTHTHTPAWRCGLWSICCFKVYLYISFFFLYFYRNSSGLIFKYKVSSVSSSISLDYAFGLNPIIS